SENEWKGEVCLIRECEIPNGTDIKRANCKRNKYPLEILSIHHFPNDKQGIKQAKFRKFRKFDMKQFQKL
ncbi:unnamed protein product, partial [marine sediment metagenome]